LQNSPNVSETISPTAWNTLLNEGIRIRRYIDEQVYRTKLKDYTDPFRNITYRNEDERDAVLGKLTDNPFVWATQQESALFLSRLETVRAVGK
jgi:hypothetical protein